MKKKEEAHRKTAQEVFAEPTAGVQEAIPTSPPIPQVTVFTTQGKTFTFKRIRRLVTNEFSISFDYEAMSDEMYKHATFFVANLAGYSKTY